MNDNDRRSLVNALIALPLASWAGLTSAQQTYPNKPVRIVVGFPPGGSGDFIARVLSDMLASELGQTIVVDNRPGAGSNIASEHVARADADGYTVLLGGNFSHAVNPVLYRKVGFDALKDFTPITKIADLPTIVAVNTGTGVKTLQQLLQRARAEPGKWNYSTPGNGTPSHLAGAMLNRVGGVALQHVPYRGGAPAVTAAIGGEVQIIIGTPPVVLPHIASGRLVGLSLTTRKRSPVIPDIPGSEEAGLPALDVQGWWGLWGPARLPADIHQRIFAAVTKVLDTPMSRGRFAREGLAITASASPQEFDAYIRREIPFWARLVTDSGATAE